MQNEQNGPVVSPIKQIELLAASVPGAVSLAQGIPSFDTPAIVKKKAQEAIEKGLVAKYSLTYGMPSLREAIEQSLQAQGMFYDWEKEIIVTCGAVEALSASLLSFVTAQKNEVIITSPSYASYQQIIKVAGGTPVFTHLDENQGWAFDIRDCEQRITPRTAAILIANPNNPTGTLFSKDQLVALAALSEKHDFFIILDEVYKDFIYAPDFEFFSLAQLQQYRKKVIRVFSFSKAYAMTGWRIAFLHSDKEVVDDIIKIHDSLVTCAPVVSQYAAQAALDLGAGVIDDFRKQYHRRRDLICERLDKLAHVFSYQLPDSSYFVFPRIREPNGDSWAFSLELLRKAKVAAVPGIAFGPSGEHHIRFCFGRAEQEINRAFDNMESFFGAV